MELVINDKFFLYIAMFRRNCFSKKLSRISVNTGIKEKEKKKEKPFCPGNNDNANSNSND